MTTRYVKDSAGAYRGIHLQPITPATCASCGKIASAARMVNGQCPGCRRELTIAGAEARGGIKVPVRCPGCGTVRLTTDLSTARCAPCSRADRLRTATGVAPAHPNHQTAALDLQAATFPKRY